MCPTVNLTFFIGSSKLALMARETITRLIDDLDGSDADSTVTFGLDGTAYEIDLNSKHQDEFRSALSPFLDSARRIRPDSGRGKSSARAASDKDRNAAIREWAATEGAEVNTRGRIAQAVQDAYEAQDGHALREALGLELVEVKPRRGGRRAAEFSEPR